MSFEHFAYSKSGNGKGREILLSLTLTVPRYGSGSEETDKRIIKVIK